MKRKNFIASILVGTASAAGLSACANSENSTEESTDNLAKGLIVHSVYFWLKEDITAEEEQDFMKFFDVLRTVPGIKELQVGKPAATTPRPVVDNSFSYFLMVTFEHMDDINTYENHPDHLSASETYSKYWTKVEVKDAIIM